MFEIALNPDSALPWAPVLQAMFMLAVCLGVAGAIAYGIRELAGGFWIFGWASMLLAGTLYLLADWRFPNAMYLGYLSDALFAPLMYMGARNFAGRPARTWPLALGAAAGLLRAALGLGDQHTGQLLHAVVIAPAFLVAALWVVARAPNGSSFRVPIAVLMGCMVGVELWDAWLDWQNEGNLIPWTFIIMVCVPLASLQIASIVVGMQAEMTSAQAASHQARQQRDLERWRFHAIFDHSRDLVAEVGIDTRILYVNARVESLLGLERDSLIGTIALDHVPTAHRARANELWSQYVQGSGEPVTFPLANSAGEEVHLEISVADYEYPDERRLLLLARDVTDRHRSERKLEEYRKELEDRVAERGEQLRESLSRLRDQERLAAVGTLAAGIAHQINNPVGAIVAAAEFALTSEDDPDRDEIRRQSLEKAVEEGHRAGRIVKSILKFARHESTAKWSEELYPVVRRAAELTRPFVEKRGGSLEIPGVADRLPVLISPIEIEQVVVNLIHNAAESLTDEGQIRVGMSREADHAVFEVCDDGCGIDPEVRSHIFEPFYTTRLREGGSGLGLSVVHGVVVGHDGQIEVESEVGRGTSVRIRLPLHADPEA